MTQQQMHRPAGVRGQLAPGQLQLQSPARRPAGVGQRAGRGTLQAARAFGHDEGDNLASQFAAHLNTLSLKAPLQHRRPSPLDPPTAAVAAQLDALQINDWPEPDAGIETALAFAKPYECEQLLRTVVPQLGRHGAWRAASRSGSSGSSGGSSSSTLVRSWGAAEAWLTPQQFAEQLHSPPYNVLLGCDSWRACSAMVFPSTRVGQRAVQAVEVLAAPRHSNSSSGSSSGSSGGSSSGSTHGLQSFMFSFCLELIMQGPYKGCWMTVGVRQGDYSAL